jgi:hypothetical protein
MVLSQKSLFSVEFNRIDKKKLKCEVCGKSNGIKKRIDWEDNNSIVYSACPIHYYELITGA